MVSQCANPNCGAPFVYLREGKLFVIPRPSLPARHSTVECFWLCKNCARKLTITSSHDCEVHVVPGPANRAGLKQPF
jgi:hypothetical protein